MAIGTDDAVDKYGTQDSLDDTSGSIADTVMSVQGDLVAWTNTDDATIAAVTFEGDFESAPDANSFVYFYARLINIVSTSDAETPDVVNYEHTFLGAFSLNDVATAQFVPIDVRLPNQKTSQEYEFYIKNGSGVSLDAGWDIHITPKTYGPHA
jgi:hypothetical protein